VLANLEGSRFTAAVLLHAIASGIPFAASIFFMLAMFRFLLRKPWLGTAAFVMFAWAYAGLQNQGGLQIQGWVAAAVAASLAVWTFVALRFGFLVVVAMVCVNRFVNDSLLTTDVGAWYGQSSLIAVLLVTALTIWAFRVSLGSRPLLSPRTVKP
jgi:hypothetical protein